MLPWESKTIQYKEEDTIQVHVLDGSNSRTPLMFPCRQYHTLLTSVATVLNPSATSTTSAIWSEFWRLCLSFVSLNFHFRIKAFYNPCYKLRWSLGVPLIFRSSKLWHKEVQYPSFHGSSQHKQAHKMHLCGKFSAYSKFC